MPGLLMVEEPHPGKRHHNTILVAGLDDVVIPDGAAGLGDVLHAGLVGPLHVVTEGEEGVGAQGDAGELCDPLLFLLGGERPQAGP